MRLVGYHSLKATNLVRSADSLTTESDPTSTGPSKPKHPNQYTYRPKPPSTAGPAASPSRRIGGTPGPTTIPTHHEHGTRRAGALANVPVVFHPLSEEGASQLNWHLPEYLTQFNDVLPSDSPVALEVPAPRVMAYLPKNHFHTQRYGPFSEERDSTGKLVLPADQQDREVVGHPTTQLEPPTRIKFPAKRISSGDVKKRVRAVLEYVSKMQTDEGKRLRRAKTLGIIPVSTAAIRWRERQRKEREREEGAGDDDVVINEANGEDRPFPPGSGLARSQPRSAHLMAELTEMLIGFQEAFSSNDFAAFENGATVGSAPPTPQIPDTSTIPPTPDLRSFHPDRPHDPSAGIISRSAEREVDGTEETTTEEVGAGKGLDVYRAGIVNKVVTINNTERDVVKKVEEITQA